MSQNTFAAGVTVVWFMRLAFAGPFYAEIFSLSIKFKGK